jgi:hypothetical protein
LAQAIDLATLIGYIESSGNMQAFRFEPATYAGNPQNSIIQSIQSIHSCSLSSANVIYSSSWGAQQIMGFNLYGPGFDYDRTVFNFLYSQDDQTSAFEWFVTSKNINFAVADLASNPASRDTFALTYNGSAVYAQSIVNALNHFGFATQ